MSLRPTSCVKLFLLASIAQFGLLNSLLGQAPAATGYKEEPPQAALLTKEKQIQQQIGRILRGLVPFDDTAKLQLNAYYQQVALPKLTIKESLGTLPEQREELLKELRAAKSQPATQHAIGLMFNKLRTYAQPSENFHPAVRYNSILILGELNAVERGARGADGRAAVYPDPLPAALDALVAEYQRPDQIDAVRVAALVGIDRHTKLDLTRPADRRIAGAKKKVLVDEMLGLLTAAPPATRSPEGHTWMQRRAIDILGALGMVGVYPQANAALEKIVADKDAPISLRCTASEALAQWAPGSKEKVDATNLSRNLGLIAVKACKEELDRIAALEQQEVEKKMLSELIKKASPVASGQFGAMQSAAGGAMSEEMYGGYGPSGSSDTSQESMYGAAGGMESMYGGTGAMYGGLAGKVEIPTDPRVIWSRRRLKYQLTCVKRGLEGMAIASKASPHEKAVTQVAKAVDAALALTDPPAEKPDLQGLSESIRKGVRGLAFLAPEAAVIGAEPVVDAAAGPAPATPAAAAAVDPASPAAAAVVDPAKPAAVAPAAPAVDPADGALPADLPPGL